MRLKHSFLASAVVHAALITALAAWTILPEKEEEVVLELSLAAPADVPAEQPREKPSVQKSLSPSPTVAKEAPVVADTKADPQPVSTVPIAKNVAEPSPPLQTESPEPLSQPVVTPPPPPAPLPVDTEAQYLDAHLSQIRDILVKYRKYPNAAVRLRQEGSVRVSFRLKHNGEVEDVAIVSGSGHEILDEDAIALIRKTASYFPKPSITVRITVPLNYSLKKT